MRDKEEERWQRESCWAPLDARGLKQARAALSGGAAELWA